MNRLNVWYYQIVGTYLLLLYYYSTDRLGLGIIDDKWFKKDRAKTCQIEKNSGLQDRFENKTNQTERNNSLKK